MGKIPELEKNEEDLINKLRWHKPGRLLLYFILPAPAVIYVIFSHSVSALPAFALFLSGMIFGIAIEKSHWERVRKLLLKITGNTDN